MAILNVSSECLDIDAAETNDGYVYAVGTIKNENVNDVFIMRTDSMLYNEIYFHWGGISSEDVAETVKVDSMGRWVFVMGET